jgi:hypothetical protein
MATLFNDKIYAQEVFQQLTPLLSPFKAFANDISPAAKQKGDSVIVPLFGNTTTTTFSQSATAYEQAGGNIAAVTVSLDKRDITPVSITAQQLAESSAGGNFSAWAAQMASSHAERMLSHLFSAITTGSFGTAAVSTAIANYDRDVLPLIRKAHVNAGVRGQKSLFINPDVEANFLGDDKLTLALNMGSATAMREGDLGKLYGYDTYCAPELGYNSVSLVGFATGKNAMAVAFRGLGDVLPAEEYQAMEVLTDNESGFQMLYTRHWSRASSTWHMNLHSLFGFANAVTNELKLLVRTD